MYGFSRFMLCVCNGFWGVWQDVGFLRQVWGYGFQHVWICLRLWQSQVFGFMVKAIAGFTLFEFVCLCGMTVCGCWGFTGLGLWGLGPICWFMGCRLMGVLYIYEVLKLLLQECSSRLLFFACMVISLWCWSLGSIRFSFKLSIFSFVFLSFFLLVFGA